MGEDTVTDHDPGQVMQVPVVPGGGDGAKHRRFIGKTRGIPAYTETVTIQRFLPFMAADTLADQ
jgi:hypothetical protein